jgi:hypothetical protein
MSEGIYDENLVVHVDAIDAGDPVSQMQLISVMPGPAGQVTLSLSDAVTIGVDYVSPSVMTSITVMPEMGQLGPGVSNSDRELLQELLGDERAEKSLALLASGESEVVRLESANESRRFTTAPTRGQSRARRLGTAAQLFDISTDNRETPVVRLVAALETVTQIGSLKGRAVPGAVIDRVEDAIVDLDEENRRSLEDLSSLEGDVDELAMRDPKIGFMVLEVVDDALLRLSGRAAQIVSGWRDVLQQSLGVGEADTIDDVVDRWRADMPVLHSRMEARRTLAMQSYEVADRVVPTFGALPRGRWRKTWRKHPGGSWVRILDPDDQILVALVPVHRHGDTWEAEAIVPTHRPVDSWIVDITDTPLPAKAKTSMERIVEAVQLGRYATMLSAKASGRGMFVAEAWNACAEAWAAVGDPAREGRARELAETIRVERNVFLADRVRTVLNLDQL